MVKEEYQWVENFPKFFKKIYNQSSEVLFEEYNKNILETIRNERLKEYNYHFNRIDPLSFFTRIVLCSKKLWPLMQDYDKTIELKNNSQLGIPALYNSMIEWWTEAYDAEEKEEEISKVFNNLEKFAIQIYEDKIEKDLFNTICKYKRNGLIKVSMLLFLIRPDKYYSLDDKMQNYIGFSINYDNDSYDEFCRLQKFLHEKYKNDSQKIYEISYDAEKNFLKEKEEHPERFLDTYQIIAIAMSLGDKEAYQEEEIKNLDFCKHLKKRAHLFNALQKDYFERNNQGEYSLTDKGKNYTENFILQHPSDDNGIEATTNEIQYWLKSANSDMYDHKSAFDKNGFIDWRQNNTYNINDIVYIYSSGNDKRVRYKTIVEKTNMTFDEIEDDKEFWKNIDEYEKSKNGKFSRLKLLKEVGDIPDLRYQNLIDSNYITHQNELLRGFQITNEHFIELLNNCFGDKTMTKFPLNQILYGPPGTGKTYNTVVKAMSILDGKEYIYDPDNNNYRNNKDNTITEYKDLLGKFQIEINKKSDDNTKQIDFVTFHQSYSYEEFVEGIKPDLNNGTGFVLEDGIFKNICKHAKPFVTQSANNTPIDFSNTKVFKMSLGNTLEKEDDIYNYCIENNVVSLGWKDVDFSDCKKREDFKKKDNSWGAIALERFVKWMDIGDIIIISNGNRNFRAIAQVKSNYIYNKNTPISHTHFRKVEWLYKGEDIPYSKINDKIFSQQSIYGYFSPENKGTPNYNPDLKTDELNKIITGEVNEDLPKPYVLIIDEINRGNISKIFGELITLIETDKREKIYEDGKKYNTITATLPYSQKPFSVPNNLYIIGTMNTADKSLALLDVALRRRFEFVPMYPKYDIQELKHKGFLEALNERIFQEKKSADFLIGQSYFLGDEAEDLSEVMNKKVVPLLMEYFNAKKEMVEEIVGPLLEKEGYCIDKNEKYLLKVVEKTDE